MQKHPILSSLLKIHILEGLFPKAAVSLTLHISLHEGRKAEATRGRRRLFYCSAEMAPKSDQRPYCNSISLN